MLDSMLAVGNLYILLLSVWLACWLAGCLFVCLSVSNKVVNTSKPICQKKFCGTSHGPREVLWIVKVSEIILQENLIIIKY